MKFNIFVIPLLIAVMFIGNAQGAQYFNKKKSSKVPVTKSQIYRAPVSSAPQREQQQNIPAAPVAAERSSVGSQAPRYQYNNSSISNMVARVCPGNWEKKACLRAVSEASAVMIIDFAEKLEVNNQGDYVKPLRKYCVSATAGIKGGYSAKEMNAFYNQCINKIFEISSSVSIAPDQAQYQLVVSAVMCLSKEPMCKDIEQTLRAR